MRRLAFTAPVLLLCACTPAEEPLAPEFAGWWRPTTSKFGCESRAFRFDRKGVRYRRDGQVIGTFLIDEASTSGNQTRLILRVANEAAVLAAVETRQPAMSAELPKTAVTLNLRQSGDRIFPGNILIKEDGPRGLRAPKRGEGQAITAFFTMVRCPI